MSVGPFTVAEQALEATAFLDQRGYQPRQRSVQGQFSQVTTAERRARVVANPGFAAEVVGRQRPGAVFWLDLTLDSPLEPGQTPQSLFWPGGVEAPAEGAGMGDPARWEFTPCPGG